LYDPEQGTDIKTTAIAVNVLAGARLSGAAWAQNVTIMPLGSHAERVVRSRPAYDLRRSHGVRVLYDTGPSVTGGCDSPLGDIHVVLQSRFEG